MLEIVCNNSLILLGSYVADNGTVAGCPEKKGFCLSNPCSHGATCTEGWGTYLCECLEGWSDKDCSQGKNYMVCSFRKLFMRFCLVSWVFPGIHNSQSKSIILSSLGSTHADYKMKSRMYNMWFGNVYE